MKTLLSKFNESHPNDYAIRRMEKGETVWYEAVKVQTGDIHCAHWFEQFCREWVIDNFGENHLIN